MKSQLIFSQGLKQISVKKAVDQIVVDGEMNEESWLKANIADGFYLNSPNDTAAPSNQTQVRMCFDDKAVYFFAIMKNEGSQDYVIQSLRRDWQFPNSDNFSIYIDPFNDKTTGFSFGISPFGVQREGLMFEGQNVSTDWDNIWYSEVKKKEGEWQAEIKVPFKTLRYNSDSKFWNIMFLRNDRANNEVSAWTPVPQQFTGSNLGYSGASIFEDPLPKPGPNISVIPYFAGSDIRNYENAEYPRGLDFGGDIKLGVTPSLNLDLTFNPDFSQVEVDVQRTNLDRFELFFPERRQFFLENDDLFGRFGYPNSRVFFSRRIGLDKPIVYGTRLSGKASDNWRIGVLNAQEGGNLNQDTLNNSSVAVFQRKIFKRSNIAGIFANRIGYRPFTDSLASEGFLEEDYNRTFGLEYNLLSDDNKWIGDIYYFKSYTKEKQSNNFAQGTFVGYNSRNLFVGYGHELIADDYQLDIGFLRRKGFYKFEQTVRYTFYPNKHGIVSHRPGLSHEVFFDQNWNRTDQYLTLSYYLRFLNTSELNIEYINSYVMLLDTFRIGFNESSRDTLATGESFDWNRYGLTYSTDARKRITANIGTSMGGFYNSKLYNLNSSINWRFQPFGSLGVAVDYNYLDLKRGGIDAGNFLIGPRLDLTLSDKVFLTTFVQYNEQINNFNINSRFQWRFKPVSDFFIVYTENYFSNNFKAKSRALVFKLTYWLNV